MCASAGIYVRWLDQAGLMLQPCAVHQCRWKSRSVDTAAHLQSCAATARTHGQWMSRGETAGSWMPCGTRTSLRQNSSNDSTQTTTGWGWWGLLGNGAGIGFMMNIKQCSGKSEKNRIVERVVPILPALPFPCHPPSLERHLLVSSVTRTVHCW